VGGDVGGVGVNSSEVGLLLGSKDGSCTSSGASHPHRFIHIDMEQRMYLLIWRCGCRNIWSDAKATCSPSTQRLQRVRFQL
jgi:hypothetical protein